MQTLIMEIERRNKNTKAKKRVKELKGFYTHLIVYFVINTTLLIIKIMGNYYYGDYFMGSLWHFSTFATWVFWGIGLSFHAIKVFKKNPFFNKDWEDRQMQKYMEEDRNEIEKYK
jgi:hypothetical protein